MNISKAMSAIPRSLRHAPAPRVLSDAAVAEVLAEHGAVPDAPGRMDAESRREMIATAAYYIAAQRGFAQGHELADWCAAEAAVDASLQGAARPI